MVRRLKRILPAMDSYCDLDTVIPRLRREAVRYVAQHGPVSEVQVAEALEVSREFAAVILDSLFFERTPDGYDVANLALKRLARRKAVGSEQ